MENYTIADFKSLNKHNQNLSVFDAEKQDSVFRENLVEKNFKIHQELQENRIHYNNVWIPKVGDIVQLPNEEKVFICHVHENSVQTTGGGSFSIFKSGVMSYSGGLDSGLKKTDLLPTGRKDYCTCWFPEGNHLRAHAAIYTKILVRVWEVRNGARLSGVPQSKIKK